MRALVVAWPPLARCPRAIRMLRYLRGVAEVHSLGRGELDMDGVHHHAFSERPPTPLELAWRLGSRIVGRWDDVSRDFPFEAAFRELMRSQRFDLIVSHDLVLLPAIMAMRGDAKVLFDAREYYPRHFEHDRLWRLLQGRSHTELCHRYLHQVDAMVTVSPGLRDEYLRCFGVQSRVLASMRDYHDLSPTPVSPDKIRIIHHGQCSDGRDILGMVRAMDHAGPNTHLDLMLVPQSRAYLRRVEKEVARRPNVSMVEPVAYDRIVTFTNDYDIGLFRAPPTTFNLKHTLPNKFFEFVQARLCVVIAPTPDMAQYVERFGLGVVAPDFSVEALGRTLAGLDVDQITACKAAAHAAAGELCERSNDALLDEVMAELVGEQAPDRAARGG